MKPPTSRPGYNARARQSTAGQRKKGKRVEKLKPEESGHDSNAAILVPKSDEQKEQDRRERLRQEVCWCGTFDCWSQGILFFSQLLAQSESKFNSKKKKRLETYIVRPATLRTVPQV